MVDTSQAWLEDVERPYVYVPTLLRRSHNLFLWFVLLCVQAEVVEALRHVMHQGRLERHFLFIARSIRQAAKGEFGGIRIANRSHQVNGIITVYPQAMNYALDALPYAILLTYNFVAEQPAPSAWCDELELFVNELGRMLQISGSASLQERFRRFEAYVTKHIADQSMPVEGAIPLFWEIASSPLVLESFGLSRDPEGIEKLLSLINLLSWGDIRDAYACEGMKLRGI